MTACLVCPFPYLSTDNEVGHGAAGFVFGISSTVAFKCATSFENASERQMEISKESHERIKNESAAYTLFMSRPHPHLIRGIFLAPEGIFMERLEGNLESRVMESSNPIGLDLKRKWERQLIDAMCWLESLNRAHGDVRPSNIMLDKWENIKLGDFDTVCEIGQPSEAASVPYYYVDKKFQPLPGGPQSEQFAYGGVVYFIERQQPPFHGIPDTQVVRHVQDRNMPATTDIPELDSIIQRCWGMSFASLTDLKAEVVQVCGSKILPQESFQEHSMSELLESTHSFLDKVQARRNASQESHGKELS